MNTVSRRACPSSFIAIPFSTSSRSSSVFSSGQPPRQHDSQVRERKARAHTRQRVSHPQGNVIVLDQQHRLDGKRREGREGAEEADREERAEIARRREALDRQREEEAEDEC